MATKRQQKVEEKNVEEGEGVTPVANEPPLNDDNASQDKIKGDGGEAKKTKAIKVAGGKKTPRGPITKSARAGLVFPVLRVRRALLKGFL